MVDWSIDGLERHARAMQQVLDGGADDGERLGNGQQPRLRMLECAFKGIDEVCKRCTRVEHHKGRHAGRAARVTFDSEDQASPLLPGKLAVLLQCCDKRDLVLAQPKLLDDLGLGSVDQGRYFLQRAEDLRNLLAHSQEDLGQGSSWTEVIDVVEWVEGLVHRSDALVEERASKAAATAQDDLWKSA